MVPLKPPTAPLACTPDCPFVDEQWLPAKGWPAYEVSTLGRIRRCVTSKGASAGRVLSMKRRANDGRLEVLLYDGRGRAGRRSVLVHVLVAETYLGPKPDEHDVDHIDTNFRHNAPRNLRYLPISINRSSIQMAELYGPIRTDWSTWESDTPTSSVG